MGTALLSQNSRLDPGGSAPVWAFGRKILDVWSLFSGLFLGVIALSRCLILGPGKVKSTKEGEEDVAALLGCCSVEPVGRGTCGSRTVIRAVALTGPVCSSLPTHLEDI